MTIHADAHRKSAIRSRQGVIRAVHASAGRVSDDR